MSFVNSYSSSRLTNGMIMPFSDNWKDKKKLEFSDNSENDEDGNENKN